MILQALVQHYERLAEEEKVDREGWCKAKVSYGINLSSDGKIQGIITLKQEEERGKKPVWSPRRIKVPEMVTRSSGISAIFSVTIQSICWVSMRAVPVREFLNALRRREKDIFPVERYRGRDGSGCPTIF